MNKEEKYSYWLDAAEYDMATAEAMLSSGRYAYVAFMCQQSLEKLAKGLYNYYIGDDVPRVHNISYILGKLMNTINAVGNNPYYPLFDKLAAYYFQSRYPSFKGQISSLLDHKQAQILLEESKEAFKWLKFLK